MRTVFWDTNLFIYLIEENPDYVDVVRDLRERMVARKLDLVTSAMTLGEVQVKPLSKGAREEAIRFRDTISRVAKVVNFDTSAADAYAVIRSTTPVRGADAIQLACAAAANVDLFVTNDKDLPKLPVIQGIGFITGLERIPF